MNEDKLEKEIQAKGLTFPRLTPKIINECIASNQFHVLKTHV